MIEHFHQLIASSPQRVLIEQIELAPLAEEITQHNPCFLVPVTILPDFVQALYRGVDNVAGILSGVRSFMDALLP
jgi:hypothetical protein